MADESVMITPQIDYPALSNRIELFERLKSDIGGKIHVTLPCRVEKYDRETHKADLRVLLNWRLRGDKILEGCVMKDITLRRMCAGGFLIDFPISAGDTGWMVATDCDATLAKATGTPSLPASPYRNSYNSGFWIPDQWGDATKLGISGVPDNKLTIQTLDGSQQIAIGGEGIEINATSVKINAPLEVTGVITATGTIVDSNGITLDAHKHTDSYGGTTSTPIG